MTTAQLYTAGMTRGFEDGRAYATGSKGSRAAIRRRITRVKAAGGEWCNGYLVGLEDLISQRSQAIKAGLTARTIAPSKLWALINRD